MFEAFEESGFFGDLVAGLFDKFGGSFVDVIGVHHAGVQGVKFTTNREDALLKTGLVFSYNIGGDVEIELVTNQGEA